MIDDQGELHELHGPHARVAYDLLVTELANEARCTPKCWRILFAAIGHVNLEVEISEADDRPTDDYTAAQAARWAIEDHWNLPRGDLAYPCGHPPKSLAQSIEDDLFAPPTEAEKAAHKKRRRKEYLGP